MSQFQEQRRQMLHHYGRREAVWRQNCIWTSAVSKVTCIPEASWVLFLTANNVKNLKEDVEKRGGGDQKDACLCVGIVQYVKFLLPGPRVDRPCLSSLCISWAASSLSEVWLWLLLQWRFERCVTASHDHLLEAFVSFFCWDLALIPTSLPSVHSTYSAQFCYASNLFQPCADYAYCFTYCY